MLDGPTVRLFKCVHENHTSRHGGYYEVGCVTEADDYHPDPSCGNGLHFWPTIELARANQSTYGYRILSCDVEVESLVPIHDKCKARRCYVVGIFEDNYPKDES